jgi:hypothetical protein
MWRYTSLTTSVRLLVPPRSNLRLCQTTLRRLGPWSQTLPFTSFYITSTFVFFHREELESCKPRAKLGYPCSTAMAQFRMTVFKVTNEMFIGLSGPHVSWHWNPRLHAISGVYDVPYDLHHFLPNPRSFRSASPCQCYGFNLKCAIYFVNWSFSNFSTLGMPNNTAVLTERDQKSSANCDKQALGSHRKLFKTFQSNE